MVKRKFSGKRFYRLTKGIVIILMIVSGIQAAFWGIRKISFYDRFQKAFFTDCYEEAREDRQEFAEIGLNLEIQKEHYNNTLNACQEYEGAKFDREKKIFNLYLIIFLGAPLFFFGGTWFFKYLFPAG